MSHLHNSDKRSSMTVKNEKWIKQPKMDIIEPPCNVISDFYFFYFYIQFYINKILVSFSSNPYPSIAHCSLSFSLLTFVLGYFSLVSYTLFLNLRLFHICLILLYLICFFSVSSFPTQKFGDNFGPSKQHGFSISSFRRPIFLFFKTFLNGLTFPTPNGF